MKNPFDSDDIQELRGMVYFWQNKYHSLERLNKSYLNILIENKINPSLEELVDRMNKEDFTYNV